MTMRVPGIGAGTRTDPRRPDVVGGFTAVDNLDGTATVVRSDGGFVFPPGRHLVGPIPWRGEPIVGAGSKLTTLVSRPGQDIFRLDPTAPHQYVTEGTTICGVTFEVDDSADVIGTAGRGGVGNAAVAMDHPDGSVPVGARLLDVDLHDVRFKSKSGLPKNGSCGIYLAMPAVLSSFRHLRFSGLDFGMWEHWPAVNTSALSVAGDHNRYDSLRFYRCGDALRLVNQSYVTLSNIVAHMSSRSSLTLAGAASKVRSMCSHVTMDTVMLEAPGPVALDLAGAHRVWGTNLSVTGLTEPLTIGSDRTYLSHVQAVRDGARTPLIRLTGDQITVDRITARSRAEAVVDNQGQGNTARAWEFFNEPLTAPVDLLAR